MNRFFLSGLLGLLSTCAAHAVEADAVRLFQEAREMYEAGRWTESRTLYEQLPAAGADGLAARYNLGNACYKAGDLPGAILHWRRAWRLNPADPEVQANLQLVARLHQIELPQYTVWEKVTFSRSADSWKNAALLCGIIGALLLLTAAFARNRRRWLVGTAASLILWVLLSTALIPWWRLDTHPELIAAAETAGRYGPAENATEHFRLPPGSIVRPTGETRGEWIEFHLNNRSGWAKRNAFYTAE